MSDKCQILTKWPESIMKIQMHIILKKIRLIISLAFTKMGRFARSLIRGPYNCCYRSKIWYFQKLYRTIENVCTTKEKNSTKIFIKHENSNSKKRFRANADWIRKYHRIDSSYRRHVIPDRTDRSMDSLDTVKIG